MAQLTLSLGAAGLILSAAGIHPRPLAPWLPEGGQLLAVACAAIAYFAVNFVLVDVAVALHARAPVAATLRAALPSQAFVNLVLLSAAPLAAGALAAIGCDAAQGRYYCGPLDPGAATTWLADHLRPTAARPGRGGAHPPRARKPGGRRQPAPVRHTAADGLGDP